MCLKALKKLLENSLKLLIFFCSHKVLMKAIDDQLMPKGGKNEKKTNLQTFNRSK